MIASGNQIRAGRALLGWRQCDLAKAAGLHRKAIIYWERKIEVSRRQANGWAPTRMLAAFQSAGVDMVTEPRAGVFFDA